ncbi:MAG: peptide ABC transporter substrate-binding protein [Betaproteobacteria bacterium HGW-Betaproteobacteria-22]|nr:MAG: peptide ABC transporter substrate-binding protein [Betaproteobacteria bacterium HGW-Betaproteobacteria-22]
MKWPFLFYILCLINLAACDRQVLPDNDVQNAAIKFAIAQSPLNLDPRYATDASSERICRLIYQSLVDFDASMRPIPQLATWNAVSAQAYQFNLILSRNVFHHHEPLTADDVKATYDSLVGLKDSPHASEFANIHHIAVQNQDTLTFYLKQPDAHFAEKLIIGILPKRLIEAGHDFSRQPVGNGALAFEHWQNQLRLKRVADGQEVVFHEVKDSTVRVLKLIKGEVDLIQGDLPPELVKYLQSQPDIKVLSTTGSNFSYLGLNVQHPVLSRLKVRQALAHAIDREALIRQVMVPDTRVAGAILPPEHYAGNADLRAYTYNPRMARQLLIEAGIQLPLKLVYKTSTDAQRVRFATILQAQMRPAGIDLQINSLDWGTFFSDIKHGNFELYGLTWVGIKTPEIYEKAFGSEYFTPRGVNRGRYRDATLDAFLLEKDWRSVTLRIHQQLPYIPLWYEGQFVAFNRHIKNYAPKSDGNWDDLATISHDAH